MNDLWALQKWGSAKRPGSLTPAFCLKLIESKACGGICLHKNPIRVSGKREFFVFATIRKVPTRNI